MGILELMLGQSAPGDGASSADSYLLSRENHDFVYPVAVRRSEIEALRGAIDAVETAPSIDENREELESVFEGLGDDASVDLDALVDRTETPRRAVEPLADAWAEQVPEGTDIGVVYLPVGADDDVRSFVTLCKRRAEYEHDPFELPDRFDAVAALLARVDAAAGRQYRAVVHRDLVPQRE
ncbi:hypothetical protein [Halosolutus gelatinilyticus]|uniref:hypothetical protein n=1 Tax=Halosolutus gelatinilyticus TaxID=2931975 RepID=UPI001FF3CBDE|nr:hypothetical protein [Halosolutus gelatinilyticus]